MKINCFTCKYGYEDERLGILMCYHPKRFSDDCVNFSMYEEKETEELEKPIIPITVTVLDKDLNPIEITTEEKPMEQEKEVKPYHKTRNRLAERSKTSEGMVAYEKVAEEMRKQIVPNDLEEAAGEYSFNIPSKLFHHLSKEQQILWKKEIEQAYLAGAKRDREQMMKEAVEKTVGQEETIIAGHPVWGKMIALTEVDLKGAEYGDKVRIIIVKED